MLQPPRSRSRLLAGALLSALLLAPAPGRGEAIDDDPIARLEAHQQRLFDAIAPSVVFISTGGGFGSGFFVDAGGLILTNAHVVGPSAKVNVILHDGRQFEGTVVARGGKDVDLALVRVPIEGVPVPELGDLGDLRIGAWVAAVGHGKGAVWTYNVGMVSNIYPAGEERPLFQTQIPLNPGCSGGPIFDRHGRVVGVVTSGMTEAQAINFGIAIDVAYKAFPQIKGPCDCLDITVPGALPVFVDGEMAGMGPTLRVPVTAGAHTVFVVIDGVMHTGTARWPAQTQIALPAPKAGGAKEAP